MLALARGSGWTGVAQVARTLGCGAARRAHTERDERADERAYYERERARALLTPRGLRRATFGTSLLALGLLPYCVLRAPSRVADTALGLVLPLHAHLGMTSVIEDYATHRPTRTALKTALGLCTAATTAVGLNFNINGLGIGSALRHVWALD